MAKPVGFHPGEHPRAAGAQAAHAGRGQPHARRRTSSSPRAPPDSRRTDLQRDMRRPERFLRRASRSIRCTCCRWSSSSAATDPHATIEAAGRFFTYIGMHALRVRREVPGHLTDRLQEALWREILHMVNDGVATTGELDESIIYGPGLRWAAMGTNLIYHLAGGETGMRHMLRAVRPLPEVAVDQARGAGAHRDADRPHGRGHAGSRRRAARSASSSGCATTIWWPSSRCSSSSTSAPAATLRALEERLYAASGAAARRRIETGGRERTAAPGRDAGATRMGRLQRPHDRFALSAGVWRCHRCAVALRGRRRCLPQVRAALFTRSRPTSRTRPKRKALEPLYVTTQVLERRRQARAAVPQPAPRAATMA